MSLKQGHLFRFEDGASIRLHPGRVERPIILYYGRNNEKAGDPLGRAILSTLHNDGWHIAELDPAERAMYRVLDPTEKLTQLPFWRRKFFQIMRLLWKPRLWRYYLQRLMLGRGGQARRSAIRCIRASGIVPDVILGHSAGARHGSAIADVLALKCIVCLGYPFKHPKRRAEPERYAHLASLQTPCLILQGRSDGYGGAEDVARYTLSDAIAVRFVDADHNLILCESDQRAAMDTVMGFLRAHGMDSLP